jgi:hypothetical protein
MSLKDRARHAVRRRFARLPAIYLPWARARRTAVDGSIKAVSPETEIVIEGFPRSGNSFAFAAFRLAQERPVRIAHHLHAPAQVIAAARRGIPALVLIREPEDAVVSLLMRQPELAPDDALRDYLGFYEPLLRHGDRIVVADFSEVTNDFGRVIRRLNARYGTRFSEFDHSPENVRRCFAILDEIHEARTGDDPGFEDGVARPSADRDRRKAEVRRRLDDERLAPLTRQARRVYESLARLANAPIRES